MRNEINVSLLFPKWAEGLYPLKSLVILQPLSAVGQRSIGDRDTNYLEPQAVLRLADEVFRLKREIAMGKILLELETLRAFCVISVE